MPAPVVVNFQVGGVAEVTRAFRTIEQASVRSDRAQVATSLRASKDRSSSTEKEAKNRVRIWVRADQMQAQAQKQAAREFDRSEREKSASAVRWVKAREREILAEERKSQNARKQFARTMGSAAGRGMQSGVRSAAGAAMGMMGSVMSVSGGFDIADSVRRATAASGKAADIANSGYMKNDPRNNVQRTSKEVMGAASGVGIKYGIDSDTALDGLQKFVGKTGDLTTGLESLGKFAGLSRATGSSLDDIADAAGDVSNNLGDIPNKSAAVMGVMRMIAGQGKVGAVEMRNLASQMAKVGAAAGQFEGDASKNMAIFGMLAQETRAKGGASSATQAATSLGSFANTFSKGARLDAFEAHHVNTKGANNSIRDPREIIIDALNATKGDKREMGTMFADVQARRVTRGFEKTYNDAGGGKAGETAVRAEMAQKMEGMGEGEVTSAAGIRMQEADAKMAQTMASFDEAVRSKLLPKLMELLPALEQLIPQFVTISATALPAFVELIKSIADFAEKNKETIAWFASHPIGAIITAHLAKDLGGALIGEAVKSAFAAAGAGGLVVGTMVAAVAVGMLAIDKMADDDANKNRNSVAGDVGAVNTASSLLASGRSGTMTPEKIAEAKKVQESLATELTRKRGDRGKEEGFFNKAGNYFSSDEEKASHKVDKALQERAEIKNTKDALEMLTTAINASEAALTAHAGTVTKASTTAPSRTLPQSQRNPSET